jgi:hypothetical protein
MIKQNKKDSVEWLWPSVFACSFRYSERARTGGSSRAGVSERDPVLHVAATGNYCCYVECCRSVKKEKRKLQTERTPSLLYALVLNRAPLADLLARFSDGILRPFDPVRRRASSSEMYSQQIGGWKSLHQRSVSATTIPDIRNASLNLPSRSNLTGKNSRNQTSRTSRCPEWKKNRPQPPRWCRPGSTRTRGATRGPS